MEYYIVDTETTGLKSDYHEVTQISIIRCKDRHQLSKYIAADFPDRATYKALEVTGRSMSDIIEGNSRKEVIDACNSFLLQDEKTPAHRCMVAHMASFDRRFIHALWEKENQIFPANLWLCTKTLTGRFIKKMGIKSKLNLEASLKVAGIKNIRAGAHNAIVDTQNTYKLWKDLTDNRKMDFLPLIQTWQHTI